MSALPDNSSYAVSHTPGEVLTLISSGAAATRADLSRMTGLARSTVSQRVDALIAHGFVDESGPEAAVRRAAGRPAGSGSVPASTRWRAWTSEPRTAGWR